MTGTVKKEIKMKKAKWVDYTVLSLIALIFILVIMVLTRSSNNSNYATPINIMELNKTVGIN